MECKKGQTTRDRILECSARRFLENGYHNTGINDILNELQLPKGSFYYHFKSKKALAIQVAEYYHEAFETWLRHLAEGQTWNDFVEHFMNHIIDLGGKSQYHGCPFGVLGSELAFLDTELAEAYLKPLQGLILLFSKVLRYTGVPKDALEEQSNKAFALFEGYILYYRVSKDINVLKRLKEQLQHL